MGKYDMQIKKIYVSKILFLNTTSTDKNTIFVLPAPSFLISQGTFWIIT